MGWWLQIHSGRPIIAKGVGELTASFQMYGSQSVSSPSNTFTDAICVEGCPVIIRKIIYKLWCALTGCSIGREILECKICGRSRRIQNFVSFHCPQKSVGILGGGGGDSIDQPFLGEFDAVIPWNHLWIEIQQTGWVNNGLREKQRS